MKIQSQTRGNSMMLGANHVASRSSRDLYIFRYTCATKRHFIRRGLHFLLFCSQPHNLFLERPVIMSVRNAALLYATRSYRCRVAREIFSGISEQKRSARNHTLIPSLYYARNNSHSDHEIT